MTEGTGAAAPETEPAEGRQETYHATSAAIAKAAEAILVLTRSQDPRRTRLPLARDLEQASAHLRSALELVDEARATL